MTNQMKLRRVSLSLWIFVLWSCGKQKQEKRKHIGNTCFMRSKIALQKCLIIWKLHRISLSLWIFVHWSSNQTVCKVQFQIYQQGSPSLAQPFQNTFGDSGVRTSRFKIRSDISCQILNAPIGLKRRNQVALPFVIKSHRHPLLIFRSSQSQKPGELQN